MPGPSATLDAEWSLLRAACSTNPGDDGLPNQEKLDRIRPFVREPIRWKRLFDLAEHHGAQPLLYQALSGVERLVPPEEMRFLRQSYQTNLHKALFLARELIRILERLSALGVDVLPYKGLALAETVYGDVALRQSGDIDLLIRPHDLSRIRQAVRELGYTPHSRLSDAEELAYLRSGYECAFDGASGPNLVELQWAVQPRFYAIDFDMDGLFRRAAVVSVAGRFMKTPSPDDLFLVLSAHAAKHVWGRLIWLCDLARIMHLPNLNWAWIGSQAHDLGIVRIVRITMLLANRILNAAIPAAAQAALPEESAALALAEEVQTYIVSDFPFDIESIAYFRLMTRLREQPRHRLRFLNRLIFTPGPGEWEAIRLPRPLFPLYRLVRLSRLAARVVRA